MAEPWFRMDGSVFRFRPVTWQGWAVVLGAAALDLILLAAAVALSLLTDDPALALLPVIGMPVVLAVLFLIIAARVGRPERP